MNKLRSFTRGSASLRRGKPGNASTGQTFLIVTEGEKTEPNYLKALRNRLCLLTADVDIVHPNGTDPLSLTERAIKLRNKRIEETKEGLKVEYDEVWVVFDLESQTSPHRIKARTAMALPEAAGIKFAYSNPSFEYWLLLHEEYTTAPFADSKQVEKRLKTNLKIYCKEWDPTQEFIEKIPTAAANAAKCRQHHLSTGGIGNPSTEMDLLVRNLNAATRIHLQFEIP